LIARCEFISILVTTPSPPHMSVVQVFRDLLFRSLLGGFDDGDEGPGGGPPPGSPPTSAQTAVFFFPAIRVADAATLTSPSHIRRPLVHDSAGAVKHHRTVLFPGLLVLQDEMAVVIRSPDETERQGSSRHPTVSAHRPPRFLPSRSSCAPSILRMDIAYDTNFRIHDPPNRWPRCRSRRWNPGPFTRRADHRFQNLSC
jgi:hypothetical protein